MKTMKTSKPSAAAKDEIRSVTDQIGALRKSVFLVTLTQSEREQNRRTRFGVKKLRLIATRLSAARLNREHLPEAFDLRKFEHDATNTGSLVDLLAVVDELRDAVHDTLVTVGNQAAVAANAVYGYLQVGSNTAERLKHTVDTLAVRTARAAATEKPADPEPIATAGTPITPLAPQSAQAGVENTATPPPAPKAA